MGIKQLVGKKHIRYFIIGIVSVCFFNIFFSSEFVFSDLTGRNLDISLHYEHSWCYQNLRNIAESIISGDNLSLTLDNLNLRQYKYTFLYSSLIFVFGGYEPTNICIWNSLHLAFISIIACLIADKLGIRDSKRLGFILILILFQPFFDAVHIYHRDIVGEAMMMLGMFWFIYLYNKPFYSMLLLPFYVFLFYCFRLQYAVVAVALYVWCLINRRNNKSQSIIALVVLLSLVIIMSNYIDYFILVDENLNFQSYSDDIVGRGGGIIRTIIVGIIGYFPWTNLLSDPYWTYHIFLPFQAMMNISILLILYINYKKRLSDILTNPVLICGLFLFLIAFGGGVGHISYFCVGMPLLIIGIRDKYGLLPKYFFVAILINFIGGAIYSIF